MKSSKKGISKSRLPRGLEGICRLGKARYLNKNLFIVETKNQGVYRFDTSDSKKFNSPLGNPKVIISFIGNGKEIYFPYRVCDRENKEVFYEKK